MELEKIEALVKNGNILNTYIENVEVLRKHKDYKDGFSEGERQIGINLTLNFCAELSDSFFASDRLYGLDKDITREYIIKYLNIYKDWIIKGVAELMISDAKSNKQQAIEELENRKKQLIDILKD